ncbi:tuberoinfundibular peptide of 39 residues [Plectropomus leopardus]|uniref:tuberoinfundibular peptide of 39 residues n=1 Tax=Plectropomus leopardus TaxID=160734 RepID=UPI001C4A83D5|nr:tuberoinfundibular peptide of 39 residues [Plectropomus leopardus]
MSELPAFPRLSFLVLCILGITLVTSGFPQPQIPLRSPNDSEEPKRDDWDVLFPSISLRNWSIKMLSAPAFRTAANSRAGLMKEAWLFAPERAEASVERAWPVGGVKRSMAVADDAAFREKSKVLTSMERQKWLNSYMHKLLVVNSS